VGKCYPRDESMTEVGPQGECSENKPCPNSWPCIAKKCYPREEFESFVEGLVPCGKGNVECTNGWKCYLGKCYPTEVSEFLAPLEAGYCNEDRKCPLSWTCVDNKCFHKGLLRGGDSAVAY
jgi:hypothetical protein